MDETFIKVAGGWKHLYRAVEKNCASVGFLLHVMGDHSAVRAFFERAVGLHDVPHKIAIDKSASNKAAIVGREPVLLPGILIAAPLSNALDLIALSRQN